MGIDNPVIAPELSVSRQLAEVSATTRYLPVAGLSALPRCDVRTAYVGLLTIHDSDLTPPFLPPSWLALLARTQMRRAVIFGSSYSCFWCLYAQFALSRRAGATL